MCVCMYSLMSSLCFIAGHVGAPLPCNDIKLVDVAEMNYYASNGEGEVRACVCFIVVCVCSYTHLTESLLVSLSGVRTRSKCFSGIFERSRKD